MKEDFVSFSLAKKLKEKGFNKRFCGYYWETGRISICNTPMNSNALKNEFSAPTIAQVLKWLREEKKMNVNMRLLVENGWYFSIQDYMGVQRYSILEDAKDTDDLYSSYEAAALAGIEFVIDNLI